MTHLPRSQKFSKIVSETLNLNIVCVHGITVFQPVDEGAILREDVVERSVFPSNDSSQLAAV